MKKTYVRFGYLLAPALLAGALSLYGARQDSPEADAKLAAASRKGDLAAITAALKAGANPRAVDAAGTPVLMNAALYGNAAAVRLLLKRGADPNATDPTGATALIWSAGDPEKALALIEHGANVNAQSKPGRTPLMNAAMAAGGAPVVKALLGAGATVDARDQIDPMPILMTGGGKGTALIEAARVGDLESVRLLVSAGADVNAAAANGVTALSEAVIYGRRDVAAYLMDKGARTDIRLALASYPLLSLAAMRGDAAIVRMLTAKGAPVNAADLTGQTPLMWAASSDRGAQAVVEALVASGANPRARNKSGEAALTMARRRGDDATASALRAAGAEAEPEPTASARPAVTTAGAGVGGALSLLGESGVTSFKKTGCASCHHHTLPLMAFRMASDHGIHYDTKAAGHHLKSILAMIKPATEILAQGTDVLPDVQVTGGYILEALAAQNYAPDKLTAALVHNIAMKQAADGRWIGWSPRPPLENGDIQATALSIRSLRLYGMPGRKAEFEKRIALAAAFLRDSEPATTEDAVMRLWGLHWSGASWRETAEAAREVLRLQRAGGGWAQLPALSSDAYTTGKALVALADTGHVKTSDAAFRRGTAYLRDTQFGDGSWRVETRAFPFQPLTDTGFPHGRDQWISAAATSWAAMALMLEEPAPAQRARR